MDYLICQDWKNTSGNHAGIQYLCKELQAKYPDIYYVYSKPDYFCKKHTNNLLSKIVNYLKVKYNNALYDYKLKEDLLGKLKPGDRVFLMEYPECGKYSQLPLAKVIKRKYPSIPLFGMFHLVPSLYEKKYSDNQFHILCSYLDVCITLGHSLSKYLSIRSGLNDKHIITLFHYVDNNYYSPSNLISEKTPVVIVMGNMMRNYELLNEIILGASNIHFIICQGHQNLSSYFGSKTNVELIPFISESELKLLMEKADISLNVMQDTIGSNVIVTSMAMGLAMVCSDVGSIRDYCGVDNSIFCDNSKPNEFSDALKLLCKDRGLLLEMKKQSLNRAKNLSIDNFHLQLQEKLRNI